MNIAYFRKSTFTQQETIENVKKTAEKLGLTILGSTDLPGKNGTIVHVCNPNWMGNLIASDSNLIGLLPCSVAVINKSGDVMIGVGSPTVLSGVSQNPAVAVIAADADKKLKDLIHTAGGISPLKATAVKLYSTTTCPYCKMEAAWLDEKKVKYQVIYVDKDQKEAEDMVKKTGQMGVPVTSIQFEDGAEEYVIGFDQPQLSQLLNV